MASDDATNQFGKRPPEDTIIDMDDLGSDDGDNDDTYNQLHEQLPPLAAFDPKLASLQDRAGRILHGLCDVLDKNSAEAKEIKDMMKKAFDAQTRTPAKKPMIMLFGDTGMGKSATTNSLVDIANATKSVASGSSCTCVPTFISSPLPQQTKAFAADVKYMDEEKRRKFLQEQIKNYIHYHFERESDWNEEEVQECKNLAESAEKIMRALFCEEENFDSPRAVYELLGEHFQDPSSEVIDRMMDSCEACFSENTSREGVPYCFFEADTMDELNELLEPHIFEHPNTDETSLWPLIDSVSKGIQGSRILEHVTLLDLPGTSDQDAVRSKIAQDYIQQCDALWVVSQITRLLSDARLDFILSTYGERFGANVAIIATGSDTNVDDALARDLRDSKGCSVANYWELQDEIRTLTKSIKDTKKFLAQSRGGRKRARSVGPATERELYRQRDEEEERLTDASNEQFAVLVDVRNTYVTKTMRAEKDKHLATGQTLSIFCVSNTHYWALRGAPSGDQRQLDAETTGIPGLRKHALRMAAPAEFLAADSYISRISILMRGVAMWAERNKASVKSPDELIEVIQGPQKFLHALLEEHKSTIEIFIDSELLQPLYSNQKTFVGAALRELKKIRHNWHASTQRAFVHKYGKHKTKTVGFVVWNAKFMQRQIKTLDGGWSKMVDKYARSLGGVTKKVKRALAELPDQLLNYPDFVPLATDSLPTHLERYTESIENSYESHQPGFLKEFDVIKLNASRDVQSGYYTDFFVPMYEEMQLERGPGCVKRMMDTLEEWLNRSDNESVFAVVTTKLKANLQEALYSTTSKLQADYDLRLSDMSNQFRAIMAAPSEDPSEEQARKELGRHVRKIQSELDEIESAFTEIKRTYGRRPEDL